MGDGIILPPQPCAGIEAAMEVLDSAFSAAVEKARNHEDAVTERALISAQKELQIVEKRGRNDALKQNQQDRHEERMEMLRGIRELLVNNAQHLTPQIFDAAQMLIQTLREEC